MLKEEKNASATALSNGRPLAEKDCLAPHRCKSSENVLEMENVVIEGPTCNV